MPAGEAVIAELDEDEKEIDRVRVGVFEALLLDIICDAVGLEGGENETLAVTDAVCVLLLVQVTMLLGVAVALGVPEKSSKA